MRKLDELGVDYDYRDTSTNDAYRNEVAELGYMGLPVVVAEGRHWQGYDPDRLAALSA